jgi:PAS domain S-box-containing protein
MNYHLDPSAIVAGAAGTEEFELRQQIGLLDQAIANIPQGLCMYGPDARLIVCNAQYLRMYDLDPTVIKPGCSVLDDIAHHLAKGSLTGDPARYYSAMRAEMARGKRIARLTQTADGRVIHVTHTPMAGGGWVTTHEDVTETRRAQEAMRASSLVLESTFEHMDQGISVFDADLKLLAANRRFRELLDIPEALCRPGSAFAEIARFNAQRGEYGDVDVEQDVREREERVKRFESYTLQRTRPNGTIIEIQGTPLPGGGLIAVYTDVTKRVRAEEEARAAHQRLRDAFEVVPEGLALFDAEDRYVLWNSKYKEIYAQSADDIRLGARFEDVLRIGLAKGQYPEAKGREEAWLAERLARHRESESAHEQRLPNERWLRVQEHRTADGGSIGIRVDITELKRREDSFRLLFDGNPVPMFVFDVETLRILAVNDAALAHYGYAREQFLAMTASDIRPPEDRDDFVSRIRSSGTQRRAVVTRHRKSDGSVIEVEIYSRSMTYQGRTARFTSVIDITDRRRAEDERDRSRAFLDSIIEAIPITITVKDARDFRWILVNRAAEEFLGLPRDRLIGRTPADVLPPDAAATIEANDRSLLATAPGEVLVRDSEVTTPNNGRRLVCSRRFVMRDAQGEPQYLIGTVEDLTDRRAMERQLQQSQKMEAVGNLTGGLAHDFNNLLTIIIGNLDLLLMQAADHPAIEEKVQVVLEASERGADLTRQLLAFSRRQPLQPRLADVNALVCKTATLMTRTLGGNVTIDLRPAVDLWPVRVDEAQLEAALVNIAINARDAMPEGGRLLIETRNICLDSNHRAHSSEIAPGDYVVIELSDTGVGMPPDVLARIFDPFFTTKGPGKGTGLGLSMVFGFVKQSGGHVSAYSEVGQGTTFKLYLPSLKGANFGPEKETGAAELAAPEPEDVILAVDDDPHVRAAVVAQLRSLGYQTIEADGPAAALAILDEGRHVDLLFTDIVMPGGISGKKLAEIARTKRRDLKVLFTSGFPGAFLGGRGELDEHDALLSKPYRKQELAKAVREALR